MASDQSGTLTNRLSLRARSPSSLSTQSRAIGLIERAKALGLNRRGAPLSIVRRADSQVSVESQVMQGTAMNFYVVAYTLENPQGERRDVIILTIPRKVNGYQ